jgi:putative isomerase
MPYDHSPYLNLLKNRINLRKIPFSERGSRMMVFRSDNHLTVRLAERWYKADQQLEGYLQRAPLIEDWCLTDDSGQLLDLAIETYPHRLNIHTRVGDFTLIFHDAETLLLILPAGRCGLSFRANLDQARPDRRGGILRLVGNIRRNVAYTTNARIMRNQIEPIESEAQRVSVIFESDGGAVLSINITPRLGFNRYLPAVAEALEAAARRWHDWFAAAPAVEEVYRAQYYYAWWVMRAGLISTRFFTTREAMLPSKVHYVGVWQWDAYFHALAYRHVDMKLAKDQLRIVLDHQREDGMIPDAVYDEGIVTRLSHPIEEDVTKPPILAWSVWKLYEYDHDREFLDEIYESIVRWNNWWFEQNDSNGDGLCEYQHPYSSGLDDSPLWDDGMPVEAPDLNTYLCLQQEALSKIARVIGEDDDAKLWADRAEAMADRLIREVWDEKAGLFWARRPTTGTLVDVRTPFSLFPLITGRLPPDILRRLIAHLNDEREFWPRYPVPTVALDDSKFNPLQMWRGPTWVNVNYLLIEGLQRTGYIDLARELRRRTLDMISSQNDIYEYYHPLTGEAPPKAASIFGWSSAIFIDLAIQAAHDISHFRTTDD